MRKNYLLMAAAAMLLASCSNEADSPKNPEDNNSNEDVLTLTTLDPSTQASRIKKVEGTRDGEKKERLTEFATIAPVEDAAEYVWSATGIDLKGNKVYVSWHSDKQAKNPALKWGGALDVLTSDGENLAFEQSYVTDQAKFNNVVFDAASQNFFLPLTDAKKGAAIARVKLGETYGPVRAIGGTSANYLEVKDGKVIAVTGYSKGGVFSIASDFVAHEEGKNAIDTIVSADNFGGKYIVGDYVLRTDDKAAYIYDIAKNVEYNIGAPLLSSTKDAEKYDPETGTWNTETGNAARYYGKHTMAVDGDYIYVAGGQAESGTQNGLRVIRKSDMTQVWGNATNTTAVCVAGDYVYAATGAGLRVYKKFNGEKCELFAFESELVLDENGQPVLNEEGKYKRKPIEGSGHSCNYVAVNGDKIYVAYGQTGLKIFKLDTTAPAEEETPAE
ncbi:MAG: hypothetical protein K2K32_06880 [Muribaculaceae bacterium]|nr:hypothetical protein [Muribaculaceae bacterium]